MTVYTMKDQITIFKTPLPLTADERRRLGLGHHEVARLVPSARFGAGAVDVYVGGVYRGFVTREDVSRG